MDKQPKQPNKKPVSFLFGECCNCNSVETYADNNSKRQEK